MAQRVFTERYQIVRHLARGGMAEVYLAHDLLLDRPVALKVLFPEFAADRSFVERFRREARAAANLNHPNIVSIYDWGEEGGTYFIVMEFVDGRTLRELIRGEGPLHPNRAAEIGADIAAALGFAHRTGLIHRDVKPGNVMIAGLVKVTDFGIARAGDPQESLTQTGAVMGTATYFSPEQAQGQPIDPRSDVYSLGVVLYEMVTGRPPFTGESPVAIAYQHVREPPVPPSRLNPDVPRAFEAIVLQAMAKNRERRYPSADALRADLVRFAQGRPVAAMSAAAPYPTGSRPPDAPPPPPPIGAPVPPSGPVPSAASAATAMWSPERPGVAADGTVVMPQSTDVLVDDDQYEREPARTSTYIIILAVLLAILAGMLFVLARTLGVGGSKQESVPNVIGEMQNDAITKIKNASLTPKVAIKTDDSNPAGQVLDQSPQPGTKLKSKGTVTITVAQPSAPIPVPNVVGKDVNDATGTLEQAGFQTNVVMQSNDTVKQNVVISQMPAANASATRGSTVNLFVSSGPTQVQVPSLFDDDETDAANQLRTAGFNVNRTTQPDPTLPAGKVIRTDPGAGTPLPKGSTVTLVVSSGPPPTTAAPVTTTSTTIGITIPTIFPPVTTTMPATTSTTK